MVVSGLGGEGEPREIRGFWVLISSLLTFPDVDFVVVMVV